MLSNGRRSIAGALVVFHLGQPGWAAAVAAIGAASAVLLRREGRQWTLLGAVYIIVPCFALIWLRGVADIGLAMVICMMSPNSYTMASSERVNDWADAVAAQQAIRITSRNFVPFIHTPSECATDP